MKNYAAFLRGINVGGNNVIPMKALAALFEKIGFGSVHTYINSGNVLFSSSLEEEAIVSRIEKGLKKEFGKEIRVMVRTAKELRSIVDKNPFPSAHPSKVGVPLSRTKLSKSLLKEFSTPGKEEVAIGKREAYIHYPDGMGRSKLVWPKSLSDATVRNINTLAKLVELEEGMKK